MFDFLLELISSPLFWLFAVLSFLALRMLTRRKDLFYEHNHSIDAEQPRPATILNVSVVNIFAFILQAAFSGIIGSLALAGLKLIGISL